MSARMRGKISRLLPRAQNVYRPAFDDFEFVRALSPLSPDIQRAQRALDEADVDTARRQIVSHFVGRIAPKFFCSTTDMAELAARAGALRPAWAEALQCRVNDDIELGLRVMSTRFMPLGDRYDWWKTTFGPGHDDLYRAQPFRFGFMPRLARAAHHGIPTVPIIGELVDSWIDATRGGHPESYHSSMLVLYRIIALTWTFHFLAGLGAEAVEDMHGMLFSILKILWEDSAYVLPRIGTSYPNNHLLADGFAAWYIGMLFPEFPETDRSYSAGNDIFVRELQRQFYEDGTSFEHSLHYHELGCEMGVAYLLLMQRNGRPIQPAVRDRLRLMLAFQAALTGPEATPLPIGDTIEDPLFPLDARHGWACGALREFYRALFDASLTPAPAHDCTAERAYWLLSGKMVEHEHHAQSGSVPTDYEQGGFHILCEYASVARLVFRSGPHPDLPISAGHAHADILSIYLRVKGIPLIVNSGTYTYRFNPVHWPPGAPRWRAYFAGPESHNGVYNGSDPYGAMQGDFRNRDIPCRIAQRRLVHGNELSWLEFEVTQGGMQGWRRGIVSVNGLYWLIYDLLPASERCGAGVLSLQFAPGSNVDCLQDRLFRIQQDSIGCIVAMSAAVSHSRVHLGELDPPAGWVSQRYGELTAAPQLRSSINRQHYCSAFLIEPSRDKSTGAIFFCDEIVTTDYAAFRVSAREYTDILFIPLSVRVEPMTCWNFQFDSRLRWIRTRDGQRDSFRELT